MERFFAVWRSIADTLLSLLVGFCAILCWFGAFQIHQIGGPVWQSALCIGAGIGIALGELLRKKRRG